MPMSPHTLFSGGARHGLTSRQQPVLILLSLLRSCRAWIGSIPAHDKTTLHLFLQVKHKCHQVRAISSQSTVTLWLCCITSIGEHSVCCFRGESDDCGPVHIVIGDGGNREGLADTYDEPQPEWSAYREASFGSGTLDLLNGTHALWRWHRNQDSQAVVSDEVTSLPLTLGMFC